MVSFSETAGPMGSEQTVICLFDDPLGVDVNGWALAVCHDPTLVEVTAADNGQTTLIVNDGNPPSFSLICILPGGEGVIMGVAIDVLVVAVLPPGTGYELLEITYLLNGEEGEVANLTYDCLLEDPPPSTQIS